MDSIAPALDNFLTALVIGTALIGVLTVAFVLLVERGKAMAVRSERQDFEKGMREKVSHSGDSWGYVAR